jgi:hypothetical protein
MSTCARRSVTWRVRLPETSVSVTGVPALPLIRAVDSSELSPAIARPSTFVITSPGFRPPRPAGESL